LGTLITKPIISKFTQVAYFGLTTDQSSATYGINCDVPNLHYADTCVEDEDCRDIPNTVCRNKPVILGLDPGTRSTPFRQWKPRDSLLKSCFCKEGHIRIPLSNGCYDPIRRVVTLGDTCFANYHCNDLPNTFCKEDLSVPKYNHSCQCMHEFKPFVPDSKTGLVEGCSALTKGDKYTILGCNQKFGIQNSPSLLWVPSVYHETEFDSRHNVYYSVVFLHVADKGRNSGSDVAVLRLLDKYRSRGKMLTIKFSPSEGKVSIGEATRTSSFFFENERDVVKKSVQLSSKVKKDMLSDYVGFWIRYKYMKEGAVLSVGLNGSPFADNYALISWTDKSEKKIKELKYVGFTATKGTTVEYGARCILQEEFVGGSNPSPMGGSEPGQQPSVIDAFRMTNPTELDDNPLLRSVPPELQPSQGKVKVNPGVKYCSQGTGKSWSRHLKAPQ